MGLLLSCIYLVMTLLAMYHAVNPIIWELGSIVYLAMTLFLGMPWFVACVGMVLVLGVMAVNHLSFLRKLIAEQVLKKIGSQFQLSKTEEEALNVGDTWLEQDVFQGTLNWDKLLKSTSSLSPEEQSFLENETETLCSMINEWQITQERTVPEQVWDYIKKQGFWGLVIPQQFGGRGFSARAHSDIVMKIASRSGAVAVTVMVPNSLGPGELIHYYGTNEQKEHYLPRLAQGLEIPCFALTEPWAGSDATSIQSQAIVVQKQHQGQSILGLNLTFDKRWITLAPIATLIGLAVHLRDPDGLLQGTGQEGITCLLLSRDTKGLEIGNRQLPGDQAFMNGTLRGNNLFVPMSAIIGGQEQAGCGWHMLVECLSIGRSISLPALAAASSSIAYLTTGAFARLRRQFNKEIAQFEGIREKLAQIAGLNYLIQATRKLTVAAVNEHKKPSVASAITKYINTELARMVVNAAMDVHAGKGIIAGPRNYLSNLYQGLPISITVEGANIMTRNLLIFGQGAMACHPYLKAQVKAISSQDHAAFSTLLWEHIGYFMRCWSKALCTSWTGGLFLSTPYGRSRPACRKLARLSHAYAWLADLSLVYLGGDLKRKERLSARLADGLIYLYMAMAVIQSVHESKEDPDVCLHAQWALNYCFYKAQQAMMRLCSQFPSKVIGYLARWVTFPFSGLIGYNNDKLDNKLAKLMSTNNAYRDQLKNWVYMGKDPIQSVAKMEHALQLVIKAEDVRKKIKGLSKNLTVKQASALIEKHLKQGALTQEEADMLIECEQVRFDCLLVDEFEPDALKQKVPYSSIDEIKSFL